MERVLDTTVLGMGGLDHTAKDLERALLLAGLDLHARDDGHIVCHAVGLTATVASPCSRRRRGGGPRPSGGLNRQGRGATWRSSRSCMTSWPSGRHALASPSAFPTPPTRAR